MKQILELDEKDIAQIIANSYDCDVKNVRVHMEDSWEGYGPMEHRVTRVKATVTINQEGKHSHA